MNDFFAGMPFRAVLKVKGKTLPLARFEVMYSVNLLSNATADLAIGRPMDGAATVNSFDFLRGEPAQLVLIAEAGAVDPVSGDALYPPGEHLLFDGLINDSAPVGLVKGSFAVRVGLVSKLALLASGSLQLNGLAPTSFLNTALAISGPTSNAQTPAGVNSLFRSSSLTADFWKTLKDVLTVISQNGLANVPQGRIPQELRELGIGAANKQAADLLATILGELEFNAEWKATELSVSLAQYLNSLFMGDFLMESFFNRVVNLGTEFKYRVVEHASGFKAVPYSPFFRTSEATSIRPSSFTKVGWAVNEIASCRGVFMIHNGSSATDSKDSGVQSLLTGFHKRDTDAGPFGMFVPIPAPPWFYNRTVTSNRFSVTTGSTARVVANLYSREVALELAYRGRSLVVETPLRLDIGPLHAVRLFYPTGLGLESTPSVYGSVQTVKLYADAGTKTAGTTYEIGYVRSHAQQTAELADYKHPIWAGQNGQPYTGGSLLYAPGAKPAG